MVVCPVCESTKFETFFDVPQSPVHCGLLWNDRQAALNAPIGEIRLAICTICSHVFNLKFDPSLMHYDQPYDNSLFFSPRFKEYAKWQADRLIQTYKITKKNIIEIGSGKGDFLELICELGDNRGVGFDPSYFPKPGTQIRSERVEYIKDYFSEPYAGLPADLIYSRHTLEHIERPVEFLSSLRKTIGERIHTMLFLEVPNFDYSLREKRPWDVLYEHCSYFTPASLALVCQRSGFEVLQVREAFEGQFITIDIRPLLTGHSPSLPIPSIPTDQTIRKVKVFTQNYQQSIKAWRDKFTEIRDRGWRAVIWGAGAKGLSFLTMLHIRNEIRYVVDINPGKWGMYMPITGQEIIPPEFLRTYRPEIVIIMNPVYQAEIEQTIAEMGLYAQFLRA